MNMNFFQEKQINNNVHISIKRFKELQLTTVS